MSENEFEKETAAQSVNKFLTKNLKLLLGISAVLLIAVVSWALVATFSTKSTLNKLDAVELINYTFIRDASSLEGDELVEKQNAALDALKPYLSAQGPAGTRANIFAADLYFAQKKFGEARTCYLNAAKQKKAYTSAIAYFNAAVCSEEIDELDKAASYYEIASKDADFVFANHAAFSLGRVYEAKGETAKASDTYQKLYDKDPQDSWGNLAMDRIVALKAEGKIE